MRAKFRSKFYKSSVIQALSLANFLIATTSHATPIRKPMSHPVAQYDVEACRKLSNTYEGYSKALGLNFAIRNSDGNQASANKTAMDDGNVMSQANMTLSMMRDYHCPVPTYIPSFTRYFDSAMACSAAFRKQEEDAANGNHAGSTGFPKECETNTWPIPSK